MDIYVVSCSRTLRSYCSVVLQGRSMRSSLIATRPPGRSRYSPSPRTGSTGSAAVEGNGVLLGHPAQNHTKNQGSPLVIFSKSTKNAKNPRDFSKKRLPRIASIGFFCSTMKTQDDTLHKKIFIFLKQIPRKD
eukprot:SAG11_NODE_49_length_19996_cov_13.133588_6_plen_133_part_00